METAPKWGAGEVISWAAALLPVHTARGPTVGVLCQGVGSCPHSLARVRHVAVSRWKETFVSG